MIALSLSTVMPSLELVVAFFFFFNDTATTEIYTLSLHDALPILTLKAVPRRLVLRSTIGAMPSSSSRFATTGMRSEEHTSELQSRLHLVCRLLLEKKKERTSKTDRLRNQ